MSGQETTATENKDASSVVKENDVALFTDDKAQTPAPATEETKPAPETEGDKPSEKSAEAGGETPEETGADPDKSDDKPNEEEAESEFVLNVGEGASQADADEITAFAKENKLSKEAAQKLLDSRVALNKKFKDDQTKFLQTQQTKWLNDSKADKEIGGDKFDASVALAKRATAKFASPGLKKMLDDSGLGNHPEVIKMFARVGKSMQDDEHIDPPKNAGAKAPKENYEYLYGDDKK